MPDGSIQGGVVSVTINGEALDPDLAAAVTSTVVDQRLNVPAVCNIEINPVDYDTKSYRVMDLSGVDLGATLDVTMGFEEPRPVFSGVIAAVEPNLTTTCRELEITGYDNLYRLEFGAKMRRFEQMSDSMIVSQIIEGAGLVAEVDETDPVYPYVLQNNVSDYRMVRSRAKRLGYEVFASGRSIVFRASQAGQDPVLSLEYGVGLSSFRARMKALVRGSQVTRIGWDPKQKQAIIATVSSGEPNDLMGGSESGYDASADIAPSPIAAPSGSITDNEIAQSLASGEYPEGLDEFLTGVAECPGNPTIQPGVNVELTNIGEKFDGLYYVVSARHAYSIDGGYMTRFDVRRTGI